MNNKPIIRICKDHRSCSCCDAQNYKSNPPSPQGRKVEDIFEVKASIMVSALCPDCLRTLATDALTMLSAMGYGNASVAAPAAQDVIRIQTRDCNGKRETLEFSGPAAVYQWAESEMTDEDEILVITQGNVCLYSGLQADPTMALTAEDVTGFFG